MKPLSKAVALSFTALLISTQLMGAEKVLERLEEQKSTHKLLKVTTAEVKLNEQGQKKVEFEFAMPVSESIEGVSIYTNFQKREKTSVANHQLKLFRSEKILLSRKAQFGNGKYVTTKVQVIIDNDDHSSTFGLTIHSSTGDVSVVFKTKPLANTRYGKTGATSNGLSCTCYGGPGNYAYQCAPTPKTCYGGPGMYPYQCSVCP